MAIQVVTIPEGDLSGGIDARSAENQIAPGFVADLVDGDAVERRVRKRSGYQGFAGGIPLRAVALDYSAPEGELCLTFDSAVALDSSVSLEAVASSPLVVYGRSSEFSPGDGPFDTSGDSVEYYTGFRIPLRKQLSAPSGTLVVPQSEHLLPSASLFCGIVESTSATDVSHLSLIPDSLEYSTVSGDLSIGYSTYADRDAFVYYSDKTTVAGETHTASLVHTGSGAETFTITAGTHGLSAYSIVFQLFQHSGTDRIQVLPDSLTVGSNGTVTVVVDSPTATTFSLVLSAAPVENTTSGVIPAGTTGTVRIENVERPWLFVGVYLESTPGGDRFAVIPNGVSYDASTGEATVEFVNGTTTDLQFYLYWEYGSIRANRICISDPAVTATGTDTAPQLTVWGLDHSELYPQATDREGWVTHIDSYRNAGEERLISGLGGNLFSARTYAENGTSHLYPSLYTYLSGRIASGVVTGPLLWNTGDSPGRTRGWVSGDDSATGWARISAVEWDSGTGYTRYTLSVPSLAVYDSSGTPTTIGSVVSTTAGIEDWLTVQGCSYSRHNGEFRIRGVSTSGDTLVFLVENFLIDSTDWDDTGVSGEGAVFTDLLPFLSTSRFVLGDTLASAAFSDAVELSVYGSSGTSTMASGFVDRLVIPSGVVVTGGRTGRVLPTREGSPSLAQSVSGVVRGDYLSISVGGQESENTLRVLRVIAEADRTLDIEADGDGAAVCTLTSGDTSELTVGQRVLIIQGSTLDGEWPIASIDSLTELTLEVSASIEAASVSGAILHGYTVEVDSEIAWDDTVTDSNSLYAPARWIPIESPESPGALVPDTAIFHLPYSGYSSQPFLRSVVSVGNMYLSNGVDPVSKFDGSNIYRAGLPQWQAGLFLTQDTAAAARIVTGLRSVAYSAISASTGTLTITSAGVDTIPPGTPVRLSGSTRTYTVQAYTTDGTNYFLILDRALDGSVSLTGSAAEIGVLRYYVRLNAIDTNGRVVISAVTSHQDLVVELTGDAAVQLKLVGLPPFGGYQYERIEAEIYRTHQNQAAPFYRVAVVELDWTAGASGYLVYTDTFTDSDLTELDAFSVALTGVELPTRASEPLRARYTTALGNRPVYANVQSYPEWDIRILSDATLSAATLSGDSLLFRRDSTDTGTTTNMVDRVRYEWQSSTSGTVSSLTPGSNEFVVVTSAPTGCVAGDWIYLSYATAATTGRDLSYSGWWMVSACVGTSVTVLLPGAAAASSYPDRYTIATDPTDVPVLLGTDGNLGQLNGDSFDLFDSMRRMSLAVCATMRVVDRLVPGLELFAPWLLARGGNDVLAAGQLLVRYPLATSTTPELVPSFSGYSLFVNDLRRTTGEQISASTRLFPSRILVPYDGFSEVFDSPDALLEIDSDSAIDVNPADGQEITGVIPFYGESAFGASQQGSVLVVFKQSSVYLIDISQPKGSQVQRLETQGLGCTAPYSIAPTRNGIAFANESGIYCLRRNQTVEYLGRFVERVWEERVSLSALSTAHGTHHGQARSYKLSVPVDGDTTPSEALVYNHTSEADGRLGAWSRYTNHPAIGWANLAPEAFFASTTGRVFRIRRDSGATRWRDGADPIAFSVSTRPNSFGDGSLRKLFSSIAIHYRSNTGASVAVGYSIDTDEQFSESTPVVVTRDSGDTGLSDSSERRIQTVTHAISRKRGNHLALQLSNGNLDESLEIAGIDYRVGGIDSRGLRQPGTDES